MSAGSLVEKAIATNPVTITITRTVRTRNGGSFARSTQTVGPYKVLITARVRGGQTRQGTDLGDGSQSEMGWELLGPVGMDIQGTPNDRDEFEAEGYGRFKVLDVQSLFVHGKATGVRATLEMVA